MAYRVAEMFMKQSNSLCLKLFYNYLTQYEYSFMYKYYVKLKFDMCVFVTFLNPLNIFKNAIVEIQIKILVTFILEQPW